jgi:hypothetical protein
MVLRGTGHDTDGNDPAAPRATPTPGTGRPAPGGCPPGIPAQPAGRDDTATPAPRTGRSTPGTPAPGDPQQGASGYYAPAARVAAVLVAAGLTPPPTLIPGPRNREGEFCTVEALPEDLQPPDVPWCVEVVHHPEAAYRWSPGRPEPYDAAAHRRARLAAVATALEEAGYAATVVPRGGWRPGQQALHVHPPITGPADRTPRPRPRPR